MQWPHTPPSSFPFSLFSSPYRTLTTEPTDAALPVPRGNAEQYNYSHFSPRMQNQHEAPSPARLLKNRALCFNAVVHSKWPSSTLCNDSTSRELYNGAKSVFLFSRKRFRSIRHAKQALWDYTDERRRRQAKQLMVHLKVHIIPTKRVPFIDDPFHF